MLLCLLHLSLSTPINCVLTAKEKLYSPLKGYKRAPDTSFFYARCLAKECSAQKIKHNRRKKKINRHVFSAKNNENTLSTRLRPAGHINNAITAKGAKVPTIEHKTMAAVRQRSGELSSAGEVLCPDNGTEYITVTTSDQ